MTPSRRKSERVVGKTSFPVFGMSGLDQNMNAKEATARAVVRSPFSLLGMNEIVDYVA